MLRSIQEERASSASPAAHPVAVSASAAARHERGRTDHRGHHRRGARRVHRSVVHLASPSTPRPRPGPASPPHLKAFQLTHPTPRSQRCTPCSPRSSSERRSVKNRHGIKSGTYVSCCPQHTLHLKYTSRPASRRIAPPRALLFPAPTMPHPSDTSIPPH